MSTHGSEFLASKSWSNRFLAPRALAVTYDSAISQSSPRALGTQGLGLPTGGFLYVHSDSYLGKEGP